jgi:hypothetical protein
MRRVVHSPAGVFEFVIGTALLFSPCPGADFLIRAALLLGPRPGADPVLSFGSPLPVLGEAAGLSPSILLQTLASLGPDSASFPALRAALFFKLMLGSFFSRPAFFAQGRNGEKMQAKHGGKKKLACVFR